ncbi:MAG TPA: DinB family protein [Actinomycetes bacterium]|nr:DinB family protein [Actinomycetes bacterium]
MTEFVQQDLKGARFDDVYLTGATFHDVELDDATFRMVTMRRTQIRDAILQDMVIDAELDNVVINGVDVVPLVEAELDRRQPDRVKMRPTDPDGFREAWTVLERLWAGTVERARRLPEDQLHERVDREWSFVQTLRHLSFATDAWVRRALLGEPDPWHPLDLPHDDMADSPPVPRDYDARPSLDEVLALRADRMATVRAVVDGLTDQRLDAMTEPVTEPGYPAPESYPVRRVLRTILNEEWLHRQFAERDLAVLESRTPPA